MSMYLNAIGDIAFRDGGLGDSIPQADAITAAGWIRIVSDINEACAIFERYGNSAGSIWQGIYIAPSGTGVRVGNSAGSYSAATEIGVDVWAHVAYVRNGATHTLFVDAVSAGTSSGAPGADTTPSFAIGGNGVTNRCDAEFAHWRIWEAALTADELAAERISPVPVRTANLWADYAFENGALTVDSSGNSRTARLNGTVDDGTTEPIFPQIARAQSDIAAGAWTPSSGATVAGVIDEAVPSDGDFASSNTAADVCTVALAALSDPAASTGHVVRYRISGDGVSGMQVQLLQDTTVIATWTHDPAPTTPTTYNQTLSGTQADSITDYSALRLRFTEV